MAVFPAGLPVHEHLFYRDLQVSKLAGALFNKPPSKIGKVWLCRCAFAC
jgi:hypothetical protein